MKKIILLMVMFLLYGYSLSFAAQKLFYDASTGKQIVDVSGTKTVEQIKSEFGITNCQEVIFNETKEAVRITNGSPDKYDYIKENSDIKISNDQNKKDKEDKIKQKLGLSDKEFNDLKEAIK